MTLASATRPEDSATPIGILLVEDLPTDEELIRRALQRAGLPFRCDRVLDEAGLRRALADGVPDIVLSDFNLPGFDGMEALAIVRGHDPHVPFVFVSGTIGEDRAIEALRQGATDYVLKSNLTRLAPSIRRALTEAATARAHRAAEAQLRANERRLRDIVETSQDWIWEMDRDGRFTFCSGAVAKMLGHAPEELIGRPFAELLHPDDARRQRLLLPPTGLVDGRPASVTVTARWQHRDGSPRWFERTAIALVHDGATTGFRGTERDLTQRLLHEQRIARLNRIHGLLSSVNMAVARATDRQQVLADVCRMAVERGGYVRCLLALADPPGSASLRTVALNTVLEERAGSEDWPLAPADPGDPTLTGLVTTVLRTLQPAVCDDLRPRSPRRIPHQSGLYDLGVRAIAMLPVLVDGRAVGVLSFEAREPDVFDAEELTLLADVAADTAFALQYFEKDEAVQFLSWFDPLTQLARRELFYERLGRLLGARPDAAAAVLILDVERLGLVNDSFGRDLGDTLLRAAAMRLRNRLGDVERLAHFGAGVFAILWMDADEEPLPGLRQRVRALFAEPFTLGGREVDVSVRTGCARYPDDAAGARPLVENAETALRRAKETGADDFDYTVTLNSELADRMRFAQKLHRALEQRQYRLHYQPVVDLDTGALTGVEALLRWHDPERGLVPPVEFIGHLERSGQIVEVGEWVFDQAAADAARLRAAGGPRLKVAVNLSPLQLRDRGLAGRLADLQRTADGAAPWLEVEITESMLMRDLEASIATLRDLRAAGVTVSIDDFGTGYSSLALLSRLPADRLKIDRSFTSGLADDPASMAVVTTIINLARSFRLEVIAEGVEQEGQLKMLRLMKCDYGQGYLWSRPLALDDLLAWIAARR